MEGAACEESAIGAACSNDDACAAPYSHCVTDADGAGYCSGECESTASCPSGWTCEPEAAVRVCKKLPTGFGVSCQTSADCAGYEATYCEAFRSHTCQLQDCASGATTCPSEWGCCDFTALIGVSMCMAPEALVDGACPGGAKLVKP
jgi:hypothetical protein